MCKEDRKEEKEKILENYKCEGQYVFDFSDKDNVKIVEEKNN